MVGVSSVVAVGLALSFATLEGDATMATSWGDGIKEDAGDGVREEEGVGWWCG